MERLTGYVSGYAHGKAGVTIKAALSNRTLNRGRFECTGMIERLAQYEDTGLTPAEVAEYAKAKAEGRVVVLTCKCGNCKHAEPLYAHNSPTPIGYICRYTEEKMLESDYCSYGEAALKGGTE